MDVDSKLKVDPDIFLDSHLVLPSLEAPKSYDRFREFEELQFDPLLNPDTTIIQFLAEWKSRLDTAVSAGCLFNDTALAFKLLTSCRLEVNIIHNILREVTESKRLEEEEDEEAEEQEDRESISLLERVSLSLWELYREPDTDPLMTEKQGEETVRNKRPYMRKKKTSKELAIEAGGTEERPYKCRTCGQAFGKMETLNTHIRYRHTGERPYSCTQCPRAFHRSSELRKHQRVHTGERPYRCEVCGKSFSQAGVLKRHSVTHTGEKQFSCEECGKLFTRAHMMQLHRTRVHTGKAPYSCPECGKLFSDISHLAVHRRSHTGERPFHCEICSKGFVRKDNLERHLATHTTTTTTSSKKYKCETCEKSFSQAVYLKRHERTHREDGPAGEVVVGGGGIKMEVILV